MNRQELYDLLKEGPVLLDGATGSNLQKHGLKPGVCPEQWILDHEEVFLQLQRDYVEAGSRILYAPTFTGNRIKLAEYGLENSLEEINGRLVALSKKAAAALAAAAAQDPVVYPRRSRRAPFQIYSSSLSIPLIPDLLSLL